VIVPVRVLLQSYEALLCVLQMRFVKAPDAITQLLVAERRVERKSGVAGGFTDFLYEPIVERVLRIIVTTKKKRRAQ